MIKKVYLILGFLSLFLGILGSFLPILPTTPFVLLSAFLFSKSSNHWYQWLISIPKFGNSIQDWNEHGTINLKGKILCFFSISLVILWISIYSNYHILLKTTLPVILILVLTFVLTRPHTKMKNN